MRLSSGEEILSLLLLLIYKEKQSDYFKYLIEC